MLTLIVLCQGSETTRQLESTIAQLTEQLEEQTSCRGCINFVAGSIESRLHDIISHPSVEQVLIVSKEFAAVGSSKLSEFLVAAQPYIKQTTETIKVTVQFIKEKGQDAIPFIAQSASSIARAADGFMKSEAVSHALSQYVFHCKCSQCMLLCEN